MIELMNCEKGLGLKERKILLRMMLGSVKVGPMTKNWRYRELSHSQNPLHMSGKRFLWMVPGKFVRECFDRIHCSHFTSPQPWPHSRALSLILHNASLSTSKLLDCSVQ